MAAGPPGGIDIIPIIETGKGIANARAMPLARGLNTSPGDRSRSPIPKRVHRLRRCIIIRLDRSRRPVTASSLTGDFIHKGKIEVLR